MLLKNISLFITAIFLLSAVLHTSPAASAGVFDPDAIGIAAWEEDGEVFVEDYSRQYRLRIPADYWTFKSPEQLRRQVEGAPGGCVPGGGIPDSLLLVIQNKDAPTTGASLEVLPLRFLLRDEEDLRRYARQQERSVLQRLRGEAELAGSDTEQRDGMIVHSSRYTLKERDRELHVILTNFLLRPPGEDMMIFQLQAFAPSEWFDLVEEDFAIIAGSFVYTGETARDPFVPDAPEEKLPFADGAPGGAMRSGGFVGIAAGLVIFALAYMIIKKITRRDPTEI